MKTVNVKTKRMPWWLVGGVLLFPLIFAWLTLDGYSKRARVIAFGWLIVGAVYVLAFDKDSTPSLSSETRVSGVHAARRASDEKSLSDSPATAASDSALPTKVDVVTERERASEIVRLVQGRLAQNREKLKSFYANEAVVERASSDLLDLAAIIASRGASSFKEDQQITASAKKLADDLTKQRRELLASSLENSMMKSGLNLTVKTEGSARDRLRFTYPLMTKLVVYKLQNERGFADTARGFGFKKIIYTDGHDEGDTWTVDL